MNLESLEQKLTRYEPSGPRPKLRDELLDSATFRVRSRRRMELAGALIATILVASFVLHGYANRVYEEGVRFANGNSQPVSSATVARASVLSIHVPGARALLEWNGGLNE